jgi:hypothetical protein
MENLKQVFSIGLVLTILLALYGLIKTRVNKSNLRKFDIDLEHYGVIDEVKLDTMNHATPSFLVDGEWIYLGSYGRSMRSIVLPGDSISKVRGDDYLEIHRINSSGYTLIQKIEAW